MKSILIKNLPEENKILHTETIGKKIRLVRSLKGLSQDWVSKQLGMSQNGYSKIERGKQIFA